MSEYASLFETVSDLLTTDIDGTPFKNKGVVKRNLLETVFVALGICVRNNYRIGDVNSGIEQFSRIIEENRNLRSATTSTAVILERIQLALDIFRG